MLIIMFSKNMLINFNIKYPNCSRAKTVNENLKMSAALLSRFDLVFILLDKPDEFLDKRVSEHIMSVSFSIWPFFGGAWLWMNGMLLISY